jgi:hypothetical protein
VLSIESSKIRDAQLTAPWSTEPPIFNQRAGTRRGRAVLLLPKLPDRERMRTFARSAITASDFNLLLEATRNQSECIASLLQFSADSQDDTFKCHPTLAPFFRSCGKDIFPAIQLIPTSVWSDIDRFLDNGDLDVSMMENIATNSPTLAALFAYSHTIYQQHEKENVLTLLNASSLMSSETACQLPRNVSIRSMTCYNPEQKP